MPLFKRVTLSEFRDVPLVSAILYDLVVQHGSADGLDYTSPNGNRVICECPTHTATLKKTRIYFRGKNNTIHLGRMKGVARLDVACIDGSQVNMGSCDIVRGATIMASTQAHIEIGDGCMVSRDIIVYCSGAHGVYNSTDGARRGSANISIANRVWLGQGSRILAGAQIGEGSIIGSYSVLAGRVPNNCAAAGNPCRVTSRDVFWATEAVPDNYFLRSRSNGKKLPAFAKLTEILDNG